MPGHAREIGPLGTAARAVCAAALLWVGVLDVTSRSAGWHDAVLGLVFIPAVILALVLVARRYVAGPIRLTGPAGTMLNCASIVVLLVLPYTSGAAALFYGTGILAAIVRGQPDCEATAVSNLILGRDDRIGCPIFTPIDRAEERLPRRQPEP